MVLLTNLCYWDVVSLDVAVRCIRGISVAVKQFNTHLSSESSVIKEASLMKQSDHPCFPYIYGICVQSKPYLLVLQFCNVEGKAYTLYRTLHSRTLVLKN